MKTYLEINETLTEEEQLTQQPLQIRIPADDKADATSKLSTYEPLFVGRTYTKKVHFCKHEDGQPCVMEEL